ncbi:ATP-binding cassette domain-containing protein [Nonomuraea sp. NEAU-A123]|uniref:ATP-binding cassette domain-containing protein n=1 Tax=Nonomuraea sp. NEAU-A123 TaxID=2839649 RepID=UPI001BE43961|nr:ATP-binding cassette domain-containing protein [Nonomuraea sp. NEAU-A123]MBT2227377.1 ATP-binding cassette domain-containing protein [Nonomuraea sp. NEAU-A123]
MSFSVRPGQVTGFLGPNGAGKSTTMRAIVGLDRPSAGTATVNGRPYAEIAGSLTISGATVKSHIGRILAKLHLRDRVQLVVLAYESGIVRRGER